MTHDEYVNWDGLRIFQRMESRAEIYRPSMFTLNNFEDERRLPSRSGVYVLFTETGHCQYVGESCRVRDRFCRPNRPELEIGKYVAFIPVHESKRLAVEKYWMGLLNPAFNKEVRRLS